MTISPEQRQAGKQTFEGEEQLLAANEIRITRCRHFDGYEVAFSINESVSFALPKVD